MILIQINILERLKIDLWRYKMGLVFVKDYILSKLESKTSVEVSHELGVSLSMLSSYKNQGYKPSISVAKRVYGLDGVVLHPFGEESLKLEINKGK